MKVLLVAPLGQNAPIYAVQEMAAVANALHPHILSGNVTAADIGDAMREPFDLVWFATHGGDAGLLLSNSQIITADRLVQYLRRHRPAVFLNTCDGDRIAIEINNATKAPVIFNRAPVDDEEAAATGKLLAEQLAAGASIEEAYRQSRPEDSQTYRMIGTTTPSGDQMSIQDAIDEIAVRLEMQIDDVERRMNSRLDGIEYDMGQRFDHIDQTSFKWTRENGINWTAAYLIFVGIFPLMFYEIRVAWNLSYQAAIMIVFLLCILSYGLFVRGMGFKFWL